MNSKLKNIILSIVYLDYTLLFFVFILIFVVPVFPKFLHARLYNIFFTLIYIVAAMAIGRNKKYITWFAVAVIILEWLSYELDLSLLNKLSQAFSIIFFILIVIFFIARIARAKSVDAKTILDAINGYLLLSIVFGILVALVMRIDPHAFNFPETDAPVLENASRFSNYMYYSLVSISTLGYGDIVPKASYAKSLATLISICGQFYIAILLALLVGKYAASQRK